jgi:hypothetical protein
MGWSFQEVTSLIQIAGTQRAASSMTITSHAALAARKRLSGPIGDDVVLRVRREGEERRLRVSRERVRR